MVGIRFDFELLFFDMVAVLECVCVSLTQIQNSIASVSYFCLIWNFKTQGHQLSQNFPRTSESSSYKFGGKSTSRFIRTVSTANILYIVLAYKQRNRGIYVYLSHNILRLTYYGMVQEKRTTETKLLNRLHQLGDLLLDQYKF